MTLEQVLIAPVLSEKSNELREQVITEDGFLGEVRYVAGVDVAYNDVSNRIG